jgi:hypothetical protein
MLFCDAYPMKKMPPLDRIATADPCLCGFEGCPVFKEVLARLGAQGNAEQAAAPMAPAAPRKGALR